MVRQRVQQHRLHHAEDGRVGADAQRQRQHRQPGEQGSAAERAQRERNVLTEIRQPLAPRQRPALLRQQVRAVGAHVLQVAQPGAGRRARGLPVHALPLVFRHALLEVERQFVLNLRARVRTEHAAAATGAPPGIRNTVSGSRRPVPDLRRAVPAVRCATRAVRAAAAGTHRASPGACCAATARLTAPDSRSHAGTCSASCRRPSAVSA
jgi:hypothetical protein